MGKFATPILLIGYRRSLTTRQVIDSLRTIQPKLLFFAVNAPNPDSPEDEVLCADVKKLAAEIDWECSIESLFRKEHLSAKESITTAISWFFQHVDKGIILEDDCVCDPSFFHLAEDLLIRYEADSRVMQIGATNFGPEPKSNDSYSYSGYAYIWGWATWKRAWAQMDLSLESFDEYMVKEVLSKRFSRLSDRSYWYQLFKYLKSGNLDTWDGQWNLTIFRSNGLCIVPRVNLVKNVGFGAHSTNTTSEADAFANLLSSSLSFPLSHPIGMVIDHEADKWVSDNVFRATRSHATFHMKLRIATLLRPAWKRTIKRLLHW